jgi:hypothetical protein
MEPGQHEGDTAVDFDHARADFEAAWQTILPTLTDADFEKWRYQRDATAWKYAMWDAGMNAIAERPIAMLLRRLDRYRQRTRSAAPTAPWLMPDARAYRLATAVRRSDPQVQSNATPIRSSWRQTT